MDFEKKDIQIADCPEPLKKSVQRHLESNKQYGAKVIGAVLVVDRMYKDKTIVTHHYKVYTETVNYLQVFAFSICSKSDWSDDHVSIKGMTAGEISDLIKLSSLFK